MPHIHPNPQTPLQVGVFGGWGVYGALFQQLWGVKGGICKQTLNEMGLADIDYSQSIPLTPHLTQIMPYNHPTHSSHESSSNHYKILLYQ